MATHHKFPVTRTAHVYTLGTPGKHIKNIWLVTHGYGQLASSFIHRFKELDDGSSLVIAPEGLSRFYWGGFTGPVVASWMTKGDRLDEIADYSSYLQEVFNYFKSQCLPEATVNLLGFSQGCATQVRWILRYFPDFDNLVIWSGAIPEDIPYHERPNYWEGKGLYFVYGTKDPFLNEQRLDWCHQVIKDKQLVFETFPFEGEHEVDKEALSRFVRQFF